MGPGDKYKTSPSLDGNLRKPNLQAYSVARSTTNLKSSFAKNSSPGPTDYYPVKKLP